MPFTGTCEWVTERKMLGLVHSLNSWGPQPVIFRGREEELDWFTGHSSCSCLTGHTSGHSYSRLCGYRKSAGEEKQALKALLVARCSILTWCPSIHWNGPHLVRDQIFLFYSCSGWWTRARSNGPGYSDCLSWPFLPVSPATLGNGTVTHSLCSRKDLRLTTHISSHRYICICKHTHTHKMHNTLTNTYTFLYK